MSTHIETTEGKKKRKKKIPELCISQKTIYAATSENNSTQQECAVLTET